MLLPCKRKKNISSTKAKLLALIQLQLARLTIWTQSFRVHLPKHLNTTIFFSPFKHFSFFFWLMNIFDVRFHFLAPAKFDSSAFLSSLRLTANEVLFPPHRLFNLTPLYLTCVFVVLFGILSYGKKEFAFFFIPRGHTEGAVEHIGHSKCVEIFSWISYTSFNVFYYTLNMFFYFVIFFYQSWSFLYSLCYLYMYL